MKNGKIPHATILYDIIINQMNGNCKYFRKKKRTVTQEKVAVRVIFCQNLLKKGNFCKVNNVRSVRRVRFREHERLFMYDTARLFH